MTRILLAGATGQLGHELLTALAPLGEVIAPGRAELDLTRPDTLRHAIREARPQIIVNAAGYTNVDRAEAEAQLAMQVNGIAPGVIAEEAKRLGAVLLHYSTDYVFDGTLGRAYTEEDAPNPVNVYGRTKLAGERAIEAAGGAYLILRTSWIYSARRSNFVLAILALARERTELSVVDDQVGSPTWARALAQASAALLRQRESIARRRGIYHLAASGETNRYEFARAILALAREIAGERGWAALRPIRSEDYPLPAPRPRAPVTSKEKIERAFGIELPHWQAQLRAFLAEYLGAAPP
ncbi:MAG TPA: dTDP-4-dehydrorhamnose reductase [Burkholderiales bacterium]|nr:dTDP-4-dehydrorhamnose reductase [Burkholderiales bacterium]